MMFRLRRIPRRWWLLAAVLVVTTLAAAPVLTYPMGRDQGMYATIARGILNGKLPFIDFWDIKPPPIYYLYAINIGIFGPGSVALRALDLVTVPFTMIGLYWLGMRLGSVRAAFLTAILFPVFYFTETFASLTQSDSLATLPATWAVVCAVMALDQPRASRGALLWAFAAGVLSAAIIWFKQYYAFIVIALVVNHLLTRRAFPFKEVLAFCLGGLPVGLIPLLIFLSNGMFQEMLIVAQGTAAYNAQAITSVQAYIHQMASYVQFRLWHWGALLLLALPWPLLGRWGVPRTSGWRLVILWLLAGLAFVMIQALGFDTHWLPTLPPLTLLAGDATSRVIDRILGAVREPFSRRTVFVYLLAAAAILGILIRGMWIRAWPYLTGQETLHEYYTQFQANDLKPAESLEMVDFLKTHETPGDSLFIWGFRPEVYYLADLKPATRFIAHFPLVAAWYPPQWKQEAVDTLWAAMPPYVLVLQDDYMPWVTGRNEDSHPLLVEYTELSNWLSANYTRVAQIGNFLIWQRNP